MLEYDAVVVGAGALGLSTALNIKKNRPTDTVLVIDRMNGPGYGNTGKSWACFRDFFSSSTNRAIAGTSIEFYKHVQEDLGIDLQMKWIGYLFLYNMEDYEKREKILGDMAKEGVEYQVYERHELAKKLDMNFEPHSEGSQLVGLVNIDIGVMARKAGSMDSDSLVKFYESAFLRLGGSVQYNTWAQKILIEPKKQLGFPDEPYYWQDSRVSGIQTQRGIIKAKKTIIAAGVWASEILDPVGIDDHAKPEKKPVFVVGADTPRLKALLTTKGLNSENCMPLLFIYCLPHAGVYCPLLPKVREDSFWVLPVSKFIRKFELKDEPKADKRLYEFGINWILPEYFPQFANAKIRNSWVGHYQLNTFDGTAVVFETNDCIMVGAASGSGLTKSDAIGRIAAGIYADEEYVELYGGDKFKVSDLGIEHRKVEYEEWVL